MMSDDNNTYDKSVQVIRFSGKASDWRIWSMKFLAYAAVKGYKTILTGVDVPVNETAEKALVLTSDAGKAQKKIQDKNREAYNALVLSLDDEVSLGAVEAAITDDFPEGNAKTAWDNL